MRKWAIGLHLYQPPGQDLQLTGQILDSCYLPLVKEIKNHPRARMSLNISGCLWEQLASLEANEFIQLIGELVGSGQVELLNSLADHLLMPITSVGIYERQIEKQRRLTREIAGVKLGSGLFPPELAVDEEVVNWARAKFDYILVDETAVNQKYDKEVIWSEPAGRFKGARLAVNCRAVSDIIRSYPERLTGEHLAGWVKSRTADAQVIITMNDAEAFGHHYEERLEALVSLMENRDFELVTIGEAIRDKTAKAVDTLVKSSWQVWHGQDKGKPFKLWVDKDNPLQQKYLGLMRKAEEAVSKWSKQTEPAGVTYAIEFLDKGSSSCYLYWLSNWPWWHPDLVAKGAEQLIRCVRTLGAPNEVKSEMEREYHSFLNDMWLYHWSGRVEEKYAYYDQAIKEASQE